METIMEINREIKEPIANGRVKNGTRYIGGGAINSFQRLKEEPWPQLHGKGWLLLFCAVVIITQNLFLPVNENKKKSSGYRAKTCFFLTSLDIFPTLFFPSHTQRVTNHRSLRHDRRDSFQSYAARKDRERSENEHGTKPNAIDLGQ